MSDYRRLISYLYAYEEGVKGNNIGFAKLEARKGNCRINVSVKKIYSGNNDTGVYMLSEDGEILLGKIFIRNGSGEFRTNVNADNIEDSGKSLDLCYGLTIHDVKDALYTYTTIWDDILNDTVKRSAVIDLADVTSENIRQKEEAQRPEAKPEPVVKPEPVAVSEIDAVPEKESEASVEPKPEAEPKAEIEQASEPEAELEPKAEPEHEFFSAQEKPIGSWEYMEKNYARLPAFECGRKCDILAVRPQDLGLLRREIWTYGNNSFLLHGYYRYRHLILARLTADKDNNGYRYLLGVPGNYYSNEKYMASMFGFPNFILAKKQPSKDDRFGYWYTDIRLE